MRAYIDTAKRREMWAMEHEDICAQISALMADLQFPAETQLVVCLAHRIAEQASRIPWRQLPVTPQVPITVACRKHEAVTVAVFHFAGGTVVAMEVFNKHYADDQLPAEWIVSGVDVRSYPMGDRSSEKISVAWHRNWIQKTISGDPALESIRLAKHEELYGAASPAITDHQQLKGEVFVDQPVPAGATEITYFLFNRRSPGDRERAIRQAERRLRRYIGRQARRLASSL